MCAPVYVTLWERGWGGISHCGGWSGGLALAAPAAPVLNTVVVPGIGTHDRIHRNTHSTEDLWEQDQSVVG